MIIAGETPSDAPTARAARGGGASARLPEGKARPWGLRSAAAPSGVIACTIACTIAGMIAYAEPLRAGVVVSGQLIDAAATIARQQTGQNVSEFQVPLADHDLVLGMRQGATSGATDREWRGRSDEAGNFSIDTGLGELPPDARFVVAVEEGSTRLFSPFFAHSGTPQPVNLYAPTESAAQLRSNVTVRYSVDRRQDPPTLFVEVEVRLLNLSDTMFVGTKALSGWRELFRVPLPDGAVIREQSSPDPASPGWKISEDKKWMVIDTPIPGLLDLDRQGVKSMNESVGWRVQYVLPGRQRLVQAFPVPFTLNPAGFAVWCLHKDQVVTSGLLDQTETHPEKDPATGKSSQLDVTYNRSRELRPGETVIVTLTTDNVPLAQVSRGALLWVGSFILVLILAVLAGFACGPKETPPEILARDLSGEQVLDRIADLDRRHAAGTIRERDYRRHRETLVQIAAEELDGAAGVAEARAPAAATGGPSDSSTGGALSASSRRIIERIREIDAQGVTDPALIAERTQLLDALFKSLAEREGATDAARSQRTR